MTQISHATFQKITHLNESDHFLSMLGAIRRYLFNGVYDYLNFWEDIGTFVAAFRQVPLFDERLRDIVITEENPISKEDARRIWNFLADAPIGGSSFETMFDYIAKLEQDLDISIQRTMSLSLLLSAGVLKPNLCAARNVRVCFPRFGEGGFCVIRIFVLPNEAQAVIRSLAKEGIVLRKDDQMVLLGKASEILSCDDKTVVMFIGQ